jgi:hypothetical protein
MNSFDGVEEKLENWNSNYPVFLRPRWFGKSLFVSILHYYYGLEYKDDFPTLFGQWYIGKKPTELANKYLVLRFEFSSMSDLKDWYDGYRFGRISNNALFNPNMVLYFLKEYSIVGKSMGIID